MTWAACVLETRLILCASGVAGADSEADAVLLFGIEFLCVFLSLCVCADLVVTSIDQFLFFVLSRKFDFFFLFFFQLGGDAPQSHVIES